MTTSDTATDTTTTDTVSVVVVDDHALLAQSVARALRDAGYTATALVPQKASDVETTVACARPDVVLLDLDLGTMGSAMGLIPVLRNLGAQVVVVTGEPSRARWGMCLEHGASSVLSKSVGFDDLLERVAVVLDRCTGRLHAENDELVDLAREHRRDEQERLAPFERLTDREAEVLELLVRGMHADAIAAETYVSLTTVRSHVRSILRKLDVTSQLAAVARATQSGWIATRDIAVH